MKRALLILFAAFAAAPLAAQDARLRSLESADDGRGWEAVGRLNLGRKGFCTGALIAPDLVLTAGHCLYDKETGARIPPGEIEFLAGWRNGRAAAYRGVRRAVAHPDYVYGGQAKLGRVQHDLALMELDRPIRLPSIRPFETDGQPHRGDAVGVVSYARERAEAPSLQEMCEVLGQKPEMLILSCDVDFGASGAPVFSFRDGVARVVSVVSAKAEVEGRKVALGTSLELPLADLRRELAQGDGRLRRVVPLAEQPATRAGGAKFLRPGD